MKHVISYADFDETLLENINYHDLEEVMLFEDFNSTMQTLEDSINNKFVCTIYYKGERAGLIDDGYRYIEPYTLGTNHKGNTILRAWLIKGKSRLGRIDPKQVPGWRLYRIDRISSISVSLEKFTIPKKGYNHEDSHMEEILYAAKF